MDKIPIKNIFAAVADKSILDPLLDYWKKDDVEFWGTEGTVLYLKSKGFWVQSIVGGFDFDGRVKSLDRITFIRILADRTKKRHQQEMRKLKLEPFDLVIVDLYPPDKRTFPLSMDIGGQALIRAAIKNYKNVALAFDKKSLNDLTKHLEANGGSTLLAFRRRQAREALKFIARRSKVEANW